ncbi:MAG TPA: hypothetical protein VJR29_10275 [bacterium]|nr:hypothetical protein [bacterium]
MSFDEISLTRRVLDLRESSPDDAAWLEGLRGLSLSAAEASALATVLEDRFVSPEERLDLLGRLELHGTLESGSTVGGFIQRLAGTDGLEATRHHARALASRLASTSVDGERSPVPAETIRELAAALPRSGFDIGAVSPVTYGIYSYLAPRDSAMVALAAEIRQNWESSTDPILRMRNARVLAETGDRRAAAFLRESAAGLTSTYSGELSLDERISRAAGLAVDGHEAAARFLQNIAMDPRETLARRSRALEYLPPQSLDNGSDTAEVFRSLVEDPEEPVPTRYLMLSLLARSPHPPERAWWQRMIDDPSMLVTDRAVAWGASAPGNSDHEYSQWNLTLAALGTSHADFAGGLLRDVIYNRGAPIGARREALMAYLHQNSRGHLSWETLREVLALPRGEWDGLLEEAAAGDRPLRLHFPRDRSGVTAFGLGSSETVGSEIVLEVRGRGEGEWDWQVDFRPFHPGQDAVVAAADPAPYEFYLPRNRRILLGGLSAGDIAGEVMEPAPAGAPSGGSNSSAGSASGTEPHAATGSSRPSNGQLSVMGMGI